MIGCPTFISIVARMSSEAANATASERYAAFLHYESCAECRQFIDDKAKQEAAAGMELSPEQLSEIEDMAIRDSQTIDPEINLPPS